MCSNLFSLGASKVLWMSIFETIANVPQGSGLCFNMNSHCPAFMEVLKNPSQVDEDGRSPLWHACDQGNAWLVGVLLECKAQIDQRDKENVSPLDRVIQKRYTSIAFFLCQKLQEEWQEEEEWITDCTKRKVKWYKNTMEEKKAPTVPFFSYYSDDSSNTAVQILVDLKSENGKQYSGKEKGKQSLRALEDAKKKQKRSKPDVEEQEEERGTFYEKCFAAVLCEFPQLDGTYKQGLQMMKVLSCFTCVYAFALPFILLVYF